MRAKITKQRVDSIEPGPKPIIVFDTDLPGFVLKVTPTGHRVYQVRYRMGGRGTPLRTLTLGRHGSLTPELARRQAQQVIGQVRGGIDPAAEKARKIAEDRGGLTVADLSREFLAVYGETKLKPRSLIEYRRAFERRRRPRPGWAQGSRGDPRRRGAPASRHAHHADWRQSHSGRALQVLFLGHPRRLPAGSHQPVPGPREVQGGSP